MTYNNALEYIKESYSNGSNNKHELNIIKDFLKEFGNPEDKMKIIHVAGTNGKGSVCSMLNYILIEEGYKTGLFTSPHIEFFNERFKINNVNITDEEFSNYISIIKSKSETFFKIPKETFNFFEILTIMAFLYFAKEEVDYIILETGIGGLKDSTNIINNPILTIITAVSLDHIDVLGNNIKEIALEKAGIIKKNSPLVLCSQDEEVYNAIGKIAIEKEIDLYYLCHDFKIYDIKYDITETVFSVHHSLFDYKNIKIKLLGNYQLINASVVLLAVFVLRKYGVVISMKAVEQGLTKTRWELRMELLEIDSKKVLLDGAHNLNGVLELKKATNEYFKLKKIILILSISNDKQFEEMSKEFSTFADIVILTKHSMKKAIEPEKLVSFFCKIDCTVIEDYKDAFDKALEIYEKDDIIYVAGSLYLVANIKKYFFELGGLNND